MQSFTFHSSDADRLSGHLAWLKSFENQLQWASQHVGKGSAPVATGRAFSAIGAHDVPYAWASGNEPPLKHRDSSDRLPAGARAPRSTQHLAAMAESRLKQHEDHKVELHRGGPAVSNRSIKKKKKKDVVIRISMGSDEDDDLDGDAASVSAV
mgnify:CR=1 FL=1